MGRLSGLLRNRPVIDMTAWDRAAYETTTDTTQVVPVDTGVSSEEVGDNGS